jgi:hypothetical protein
MSMLRENPICRRKYAEDMAERRLYEVRLYGNRSK